MGARLGVAVAVAVLSLWAAGRFDRLEDASVDARFALRGAHPQHDVVVVAIDGATLARYRDHPWPYPRRWHAEVIDRLAAAGARRIAYDVPFVQRADAADDRALLAAAARVRDVIFAANEVDDRGRTHVLGGPESLAVIHAEAANTVLPSGEGGAVRRVPMAVDGLRSFAWAAGGRLAGPNDAWIDFQGPPGTVPTVSFADVRDGHVPAAALRGKVVVVGASAPVRDEAHATATGRMTEPELQANAISTALRGFPLRSAPGWVGVLAVLALALAAPAAAGRIGPWRTGALVVGLAGTWLAAVWSAFAAGVVVPVAAPLAALAASAAALLALAGLAALSRSARGAAASFRARGRSRLHAAAPEHAARAARGGPPAGRRAG